jgi:acetoin utilization deacetylase AcuC-like enzyme
MVTIIYSDEYLKHDTGTFHPEKPQRLTAIVNALKSAYFGDQLHWKLPTSINIKNPLPIIEKIHTLDHINRIKNIAKKGGGYADMDTPISEDSYEIALLAVNGWLDGIDTVLETHNPTFILARPPGHHATKTTAMGFCLFSNAAIAAHYALEKPNINRVAILDWDVHHGNGTQNIIEDNPNIIYCSLHQYPGYPGTGRNSDRGGKYNNVLNLPMIPKSNIINYKPIFEGKVIPFLTEFEPDLLIVSAGYDANENDPLADVYLQPQDYGYFTKLILPITRNILFGLEGGYDLESLAQSVIETIKPCL